MSRACLLSAAFGFGRTPRRLAALAVLVGSAMASPPVKASDCPAEGSSATVWHSEFSSVARSVAVFGRFAYVVSIWPGPWLPTSRFDVFDVVESERRASMSLDSGSDVRCVEVVGNLAYLGGVEFSSGVGLRILDVSDPTAPRTVGTFATAQPVMDVAVDRTYAYLADADGLRILDVSEPTSPTLVGNAPIAGPAQSVAVSGRYAFVAAGAVGLVVVDVSDPFFPKVVATCVLPGPAWDVAVRGSHAYIADGEGLRVLDVSRPAEPRLIGDAETPGDARRVAVSGARAYVTDGGLQVIDIASPSHPVVVNSIVDTPIMEDPCTERHTEPTCVSVASGRVAIAGTVAHHLTSDCLCLASLGSCDDFTGYLDVASAPDYEPSSRHCSQTAKTVASSVGPRAHASGTTISDTFALRGVEPNPFIQETSIRFDLLRPSRVRIQIHDARGRLVRTLVEDTLSPGAHAVSWGGRRDGGDMVSSGIYFVTMEAEKVRRTMKVTLLR